MTKKVKYISIYLSSVFIAFGSTFLPIENKEESLIIWSFAIYSFFISPLLFPVVYKLAGLENRKEKIIYFVLGFLNPFSIIYIYLYLDFKKNFHPGF